ncbi:MAG: OsmC family protein [Flavobacteriales bacterium]|nr:OsmC family protein [Flavobacteriales bacterium]
METQTKTMNGFDLEAMHNTVGAIQQNSAIAAFQLRAENRWIGGGRNRSTVQGFYGACQEDTSREVPFTFTCDEPYVLLGTNKGANPGEVLLYGLLACMTTTMVLLAAAQGVEVEGVSSRIEGDVDLRGFLGLDPGVPEEFSQLRVVFDIPGATAEQKAMLIGLAQRSPVFNTITRPVDVQVSAA